MIAHNLNDDTFAKRMGDWYDIADLGTWELDELEKKHAIDEVWYQYAEGSYEGNGTMILRRGDKYALHDMGHCSCYGPTEEFDGNVWYDSALEMAESMSEDYAKESMTLLRAVLGIGTLIEIQKPVYLET